MGFSAPIQRIGATTGDGSSTSLSESFTSNPTSGNLVIVVLMENSNIYPSLTSLKDGNNNSYKVSPQSPFAGTYGNLWFAYLLSAPSNANKTLTAVFSTAPASSGLEFFAIEVPVSGGFAVFDISGGNTTNVSASPGNQSFNDGSLTLSSSGEFVYAADDPVSHIVGVGTGWTSGGANDANGAGDEYQTNASGTVQSAWTIASSPAGGCDTMMGAFLLMPWGWNSQQFDPVHQNEIVGY